MNFPDPFDQPPAIKETKKKYTNFTVREIGGPTEIIAWRAEQSRKENAYLTRTDEREKRRVPGLDAPALAEGRNEKSWFEKLEYAKTRQAEFLQPDPDWAPKNMVEYAPTPEPKKPWHKRLWASIKSIWQAANF